MGWFDDVLREIVWKAIRDTANAISAWTVQLAEEFLAGLTVGQQLSANPLVRVVGVEDAHVTVLVRGRKSIGPVSPFLRLQARVSKDVRMTSVGPISDVEIVDLVGDLLIEKKDAFRGAFALGYLDGAWLGHGMFKILPLGFGLDVFLGGLDERGLMIGFDLDLPNSVPLGSSGLGLKGIGGDFAYNFVPRLESGGMPVLEPTATDYVAWARNHDVDRWRPGPLGETAVGVGLRADLVSHADNGRVLMLEVGLALFVPGPVIIVGGVGKLLRQSAVTAEGYLAVDVASASLAFGLSVNARVPAEGEPMLLEGKGALNAFFSFDDPGAWYLRLGTKASPVSVRVLRDPAFWTATAYLTLDADQAGFGVGLAVDRTWNAWKLKLIAKASLNADTVLGWDPLQLQVGVRLAGELGLKIWKIGIALKLWAEAVAAIPDPTKLRFEVGYTIDLPWPIPDISGTADLVLGDDPTAPTLGSPLLAGPGRPMRVAALQTITGRQWELGDDAGPQVWPDVELVVPFARPVTDATGCVISEPVPPEDAGGYSITNRLETLELRDLVHDTVVPDVTAVWAAAPGGTTARLHVLARDPYAWLLPHDSTHGHASATPPGWYEQRFGYGPEQSFTAARQFGYVVIDPVDAAKLLDDFAPAVPTRVLRALRFQLGFRQGGGGGIPVDRVALLLLSGRDAVGKLRINGAQDGDAEVLLTLPGGLCVFQVVFSFPTAMTTFDVDPGNEAILVVGVRYRIAAGVIISTGTTTVLVPGRYRLTVSGRTEATKPSPDYPDATPVDWGLVHDFEVVHPETSRPYTLAAAPGDGRGFGAEQDAWHPDRAGTGFPGYRDYAVTVRTRVNYLDRIFDHVEVKVRGDNGGESVQSLAPLPNADGERTALAESSGWVAAGGGSIDPDDELVGTVPLPDDAGPAEIELAVVAPTGRDVLDRWSCAISRFHNFAEHVAWPGSSVLTTYGPAGPASHTACLVPGQAYRRRTPWERIQVPHLLPHRSPSVHLADAIAVDLGGLLAPNEPYPDELTSVPAGWALPSALASLVVPESPTWSQRALRFALRSGARFSIGPNRLEGFTAPVASTLLEAVVDSEGRPYALFLRTPEPLDWRRVSATMRIRHTEQADGLSCPTGLAHRRPLDLSVTILPIPDASAALLVGSFAGDQTCLPRGVVDLTLRFDAVRPGLARLRPLPAVGATSETVTLRFVQPSGVSWPVPHDPVVFPAGFLEWLQHRHAIDLQHELARWWRQRPPLPIPEPPSARPSPFERRGTDR